MVIGLILQRRANRPLEVRRVVRYEVGQLAELGMAPTGFDRIELRCVGREPLEVYILDARRGEPLGGRAVNLPAIPADDQRPLQLPTKLFDKGDQLVGANVLVVNLKRRADATP